MQWSPRVNQRLDKCVQAGRPEVFSRNLAPADLKKDAGGFDLPIALDLLICSGQVAFERQGSFALVGELALTGQTRPIKGVLALALQAADEKRDGLLVPAANAAEAAVVEGLNVARSPASMRQVACQIWGSRTIVGFYRAVPD